MRSILPWAALALLSCDSSSSSGAAAAGQDGGGAVTATSDGGSGGASDAAVAAADGGCGAGLSACGGACVATATDAANCGSCGRACLAGFVCMGGACTSTETCPAPEGAPADAATALTQVNAIRAKIGSPCATYVASLDTSATKHCAYEKANAAQPACIANPHVEVSTCAQYVAAQFYDRMSAAGYGGQAAFEDMAFEGNPSAAVSEWIDSVWHRSPLLSPWIRDFGYGSATGCDTADFGVGASTPETVIATYPYDGQTGVPAEFDGNEGPTPPAPPSGFPSGYPISVYLQNGAITAHTLTKDGDTAKLAHVLIAPSDAAAMGLLRDTYVMYANTPLASGTRYRVHVEATQGQTNVTLDWGFSTQ